MSSGPHERVSALFLEARRLAPAEWSAFLDRACAGDADLRRDVESLLRFDSPVDDALSRPALGAGFDLKHAVLAANGPESREPRDAAVPGRIAEFDIVRVLGEGGMGVVYLAGQSRPRRQVALKVIRPGLLTPALLRRFEHEAETLARLQHPGIAQIFQTGTADGDGGPRAYFVMEYVPGRPITEEAASRRMSLRQRLDLMARVADAVQHAHHKGVIHRDLKPANILVTASGEPKIVDFGIARVTDPEQPVSTVLTETGRLVGTLAYMSPEQVEGRAGDVDTRSDVYALGVVLYELLADRPAFELRDESLPDALRAIRESDPRPLSSVDRTLRGDVETIVSKAIEKDRARRYQSAADFADDIRRFLDDQPIVARPASHIYQLRKFARRNRALVGGVAAVFVVLLAGIAATGWQAVRARREAARAATVSSFMRDMFASIDPFRGGPDVPVAALAERAAERIAVAAAGDPLLEADLRSEVGAIFYSLGRFDDAEPQYAAVLAIRRERLRDDDPRTLAAINDLGLLRMKRGAPEAVTLLRQAADGRRAVLGPDRPETLASLNNLAMAILAAGRPAEAEPLCREALDRQRRTLGDDHADTLTSMTNLATILTAAGRTTEAADLQRSAHAGFRRTLGDNHPTTAIAAGNVGQQLKSERKFAEAETFYRLGHDGLKAALGSDHPDVLIAAANLAQSLWRQNKLAEADALYRPTLAGMRRAFGDEHGHVLTVSTQYGLVLTAQQRWADAEPMLRFAVEGYGKKLGTSHARTREVAAHLAAVQRMMTKQD